MKMTPAAFFLMIIVAVASEDGIDDAFADAMRTQEWPIRLSQSKENSSELLNKDLVMIWNDTTQDDVTTFTLMDTESSEQEQSTSFELVVQSTLVGQVQYTSQTSTVQAQNTVATAQAQSTFVIAQDQDPVVSQTSTAQEQATVVAQTSTTQVLSSDIAQSPTTQAHSSGVDMNGVQSSTTQAHFSSIVQSSTAQARSSNIVQSSTTQAQATLSVMRVWPGQTTVQSKNKQGFEIVSGLEILGPVQVLLKKMELGVPSSTNETVYNPFESVSIIFPAGAWDSRRGLTPLTLTIFLLPNKTCGPVIDLGPREKTLLLPIKVSLLCQKNAQAFRLNTTNGNWVKNQDQKDASFSTMMLGVYGVMEIPELGLDYLWIAVGTSFGTMILLIVFVMCVHHYKKTTATTTAVAELCFATE
jgi:hypothetical protein